MTELQDKEKRIVVHIVSGRNAGMRRIIGHMIFKATDQIPMKFQNVSDGAGGMIPEVAVAGNFPKYILYKEVERVPEDPEPPKARVLINDGKKEVKV